MDKGKKIEIKAFEDIKHIDEYGNEFWLARELQVALEYSKWQKFLNVINKAEKACENSGYIKEKHFTQIDKLSKRANNATTLIIDYKLSRYACYLIVQNADSSKEVVAMGQTYFAIQTRKQELTEQEYSMLSEDDKRFYQRNLTKKGNYFLNKAAKNAGVKNFDEFHNAGYKGLYNGETADDIAKRKGLRYREEILDNMGSIELAANLFRITQTEQKITNEKIKGEKKAKDAHYNVGKNLRKFIKDNGGTMPEKLGVPKKSLKELKKEAKRKLNSFTNVNKKISKKKSI